MYARLASPELKETIEQEVLQVRKRSSIVHYPALILIFGAIAASILYTRAYGLIYWIREALRGTMSEHAIALTLATSTGILVAIALVPLLRDMIREQMFFDYYFCATCNVLERDDAATCPRCSAQLETKETFFYSHQKDEIEIALGYGLQPADEE